MGMRMVMRYPLPQLTAWFRGVSGRALAENVLTEFDVLKLQKRDTMRCILMNFIADWDD